MVHLVRSFALLAWLVGCLSGRLSGWLAGCGWLWLAVAGCGLPSAAFELRARRARVRRKVHLRGEREQKRQRRIKPNQRSAVAQEVLLSVDAARVHVYLSLPEVAAGRQAGTRTA